MATYLGWHWNVQGRKSMRDLPKPYGEYGKLIARLIKENPVEVEEFRRVPGSAFEEGRDEVDLEEHLADLYMDGKIN